MPRRRLRTGTEGRLNDSILAKVVRNCASSWAQAGLLQGRTFKHRQQIKPHFVSVTMALAIGFTAGIRGESLFSSPWMRVLDADPATARNLALEAKRAGLLDLRYFRQNRRSPTGTARPRLRLLPLK
jgi:hypothetical protein